MGACLSDCCEPLYSQSGKDGPEPEQDPPQPEEVVTMDPVVVVPQAEEEQDSPQPEEVVTMDPVVVEPQAEEEEPEDQDEVSGIFLLHDSHDISSVEVVPLCMKQPQSRQAPPTGWGW